MAFLGPEDLKSFLNESIISPYNEKRIEQAAYELSLGNEVYRTDAKEGKIESLNPDNKMIQINPGQFALLLTKEKVSIPADKLAFISIKAGPKLKGLINVSGFHVDPGFIGQLLFSVYNAGPSPINLETDEPYFLIWFTNLISSAKTKDIYNENGNNHQNQKGIKAVYIDALKGGELASPNAILKKIENLKNDLENSIKDVSHKKLRLEYFLTIIIGLLVTIGVKLYWDNKAVDFGYQKRLTEEILLKEFGNQQRLIEEKPLKEFGAKTDLMNSNIVPLQAIDSLINLRIKQKHEHSK